MIINRIHQLNGRIIQGKSRNKKRYIQPAWRRAAKGFTAQTRREFVFQCVLSQKQQRAAQVSLSAESSRSTPLNTYESAVSSNRRITLSMSGTLCEICRIYAVSIGFNRNFALTIIPVSPIPPHVFQKSSGFSSGEHDTTSPSECQDLQS